MSTLLLFRYALALSAAALLAACGGSQPPIGAPGVMAQARAIATHTKTSGSWMLPEANKGDLLYVSSDSTDDVYVFTYPKEKLVGTLSGFNQPRGLCADNSGNIFVTITSGEIVEFAHGGTSPIATLGDSGYEPFGCSIDPTTGNLAVADQGTTPPGGYGNIAVYRNAQGAPSFLSDPQIEGYIDCAYDDKGNLFVDGYDGASTFAELASGSSNFQNLTLPFISPFSIQWDGKYVAVGSVHGKSNGSVINRLAISGSSVKIAGSTFLTSGGHNVALGFFSVHDGKAVGTFNGRIGTWKYPAGGSPTRVLQHYTGALGVAFSVAPSR